MIETRAAVPADDAALARIDAATWTTLVSPAPPPPPGSTFLGDRHLPTDLLVAELDATVAGFVSMGRGFDIPAHAHVLEIHGLAVDPALTGRGVGHALVTAAVDRARARGASKLALRVLGTNTVARRLYAGCGFEVEGVLRAEFLLDGRFVDDVLMACHLA